MSKMMILGAGVRAKLMSNNSAVATGVKTTTSEFATAMADIDFYRESAFRAVKEEMKTMVTIFHEHSKLNDIDTQFELYREGIRDFVGVAIDALIKFFEGMHIAIQKGVAYFISDEGIMKKYNALEEKMTKTFETIKNSSRNSESHLAESLSNSKIKWKSLTVKLPTYADNPEVPLPISHLLDMALNLVDVNTLLGYDINTKRFVNVDADGNLKTDFAAILKDDFLTGGLSMTLDFGQKYEGSTIAKLVALSSIFKSTVSGDLVGSEHDAMDKSEANLVQAKSLTEQFIKFDNLQGAIFQAVAREYTTLNRTGHTTAKALLDTSFLNMINKSKPVTFAPKTAMPLAQFIFNTIGPVSENYESGRGHGKSIQELLAHLKDKKKANLFLELATQAKSWKKSFNTAKKANKKEYKGDDSTKTQAAKNIDSLSYVMNKYVAVMNNVVKTYTSTLIDTRAGIHKVIKDYNDYVDTIDKLLNQAELDPSASVGTGYELQKSKDRLRRGTAE